MKQIQQNSISQQIMKVLFENEDGLKASQIKKILVQNGHDKNKIHEHSHLQRWKNQKNQILIHDMESGIYKLTEYGREKFQTDHSVLV